MRILSLLVALVGVAIFPVGNLSADTFELVAVADATVESNGVNGQEIVHDDEAIQTSMSGGSNVRDGLFEFDLSSIPDGATIVSATLNLRTSSLITNTNSEADVEFFAITGNGVLEISDENAAATNVASVTFVTGTAANTDVEIEFNSVAILNSVVSDGNSDDFLTVRTETENFVLFRVHSLESTDSSAVPASLSVTFTGGIVLGDVNMDCNVDLLDVKPFVDALTNGEFIVQADINEDGEVNLLDVAPFVELLTGT